MNSNITPIDFVLFEHNDELHKFPIYLQAFVRTR